MARISYDEFVASSQSQQTQVNTTTQSHPTWVKYFSLKNDGDEAIVRFMYNDPSELDICDIHTIKGVAFDTKYSCLRSPKDPLENCPLCKAGVKTDRRVYLKMLQYFPDGNGGIRVEPRVWERSPRYVATIKTLMDEYAPICDYVFKVKRSGAAGSTQTTYTILPCNPTVYTTNVYKKEDALFANYHVIGSTVVEKSYDELIEIANKLKQSQTPQEVSEVKTAPRDTYSTPSVRFYQPQQQTIVHDNQERRDTTPPWESSAPVRRY